MPNSTNHFREADFLYVTSGGQQYRVLGMTPDPARLPRVLIWQAYWISVLPPPQNPEIAYVYWITWEAKEGLLPDARDERAWARALRRYAIEHSLCELEQGHLSGGNFPIISRERQLLEPFLHRRCTWMTESDGDLTCSKNAGGDPATTPAVCDACAVPDEFERCAHLCNVRTHPLTTDQHGVERRECQAQCRGDRAPSERALPHACHAGGGQRCFEPPTICSPQPPPSRRIGFNTSTEP